MSDPDRGYKIGYYKLGWDDGYAEGYACKLVDVAKPFMPEGTAAEIEAMADYIMSKRATQFTRPEAIGLVRGMLKASSTNGYPQEIARLTAALMTVMTMPEKAREIARKAIRS